MKFKPFYEKLEKVYDFINNEEEARICKDIPDRACVYVPHNFFLLVISSIFTKLGDALSNPKTVLAWLMTYVSAPLYLIGFLVPIRESGSLLPQIIIASYIRRLSVRKWVWILGAIFQFFSIAGIGFVTIFFSGITAGWLIIVLLIFFSISRGLSSVSSKDVIGKTIPKTRRGILNGYSTSISGILVIFIGLFIIIESNKLPGIGFYAFLIFLSSIMWLIGALIYSFVKEYPGETSGGRSTIKEALSRLDLLKNDEVFRNFVITRSLMLCSALTAPFYVVLAQEYLGEDIYILGIFILLNGIASSISAPFWGKMADRSSKSVMLRAVLITSILGIVIFIIVTFVSFLRETLWLYPLAFLILGIAHSGVRLGRKTYILDMAGGNKRTDYVAVSNTVIGAVLLLTGGISALASMLSPEGIVLVLSLFGIAGAYSCSKLPEVE